MQRIRTVNNTYPILSDRLAIVVAIACVASLAACDFHKRREYKGEAPVAPVASTGDGEANTAGVNTAAKPSDTKPPPETPPAETPPAETPPAETPPAGPAAAMEMPKGNGCDAAGVRIANLQLEQLAANVPPEQQAQFVAMLTQTRDEMQKRCTEEKWDPKKRACVIASTSLDDFRACVLPDPKDHPECAAAADNFIAIRLSQVPEEQRAQMQAMAESQRMQIVEACVVQSWSPEMLQCMTKAKTNEEVQPCLQMMQPPQP